ncbi:TetR/AcrR family transcriptional regulator [Nocardioides albus]|uniref:AcrR family transcriptional regulator n=1 Tax=Nocardioides albus TaxID=1841 RepID=A0A7W5F9D0_9ACTN|nr:TetR/AcrR family transcriptional regulator [Nocardioides albus]MBB3089877.1 AcrR family transcriptional regulator [Nocardioides albus]GGU36273.1 TetR family transcriptional regulator [Nocardioides albus]
MILDMGSSATGRQPRTDAQRNRTHILEVAAQCFAELGLDVSMNVIAKKAEVGPATLYRNFPTRDALLSAVLDDRGPDLAKEAAVIEAEEVDSREALERWLVAVAAWMRVYEGLPEPLRTAQAERTSLTPRCDDVIATTDRFLTAAKRDGYARADVRGRDLYLGTLAAVWAAGAISADDAVEPRIREMLRSGWAIAGSGD